MDKEFKKVDAPIIGADGNVFNLVAICSKELKKSGYGIQAKEMQDKVFNAKSYDDALSIMLDYVNPTDLNNNSFDDLDYDENIYI